MSEKERDFLPKFNVNDKVSFSLYGKIIFGVIYIIKLDFEEYEIRDLNNNMLYYLKYNYPSLKLNELLKEDDEVIFENNGRKCYGQIIHIDHFMQDYMIKYYLNGKQQNIFINFDDSTIYKCIPTQ